MKLSRFFELFKAYRDAPTTFSIFCRRKRATREIGRQIEENILKELSMEKRLIENKRYAYQVV